MIWSVNFLDFGEGVIVILLYCCYLSEFHWLWCFVCFRFDWFESLTDFLSQLSESVSLFDYFRPRIKLLVNSEDLFESIHPLFSLLFDLITLSSGLIWCMTFANSFRYLDLHHYYHVFDEEQSFPFHRLDCEDIPERNVRVQ
jgi:hypothetical protein